MNLSIATPSGYAWLADLALQSGAVESDELSLVIATAAENKETGVDAVIAAGLVREDDFCEGLATMFQLQWISGELKCEADDVEELKETLDPMLAVQHQVFPIKLEEGVLTLVCYDPLRIDSRQTLARRINHSIVWKVASRRRVREAISQLYGVGAGTFEQILEGRDTEDLNRGESSMVIDDDMSEEASVLKFVNNIIREALAQQATDIHVEPHSDKLVIRYRVDGHLIEVPIPDHIHKLEAAVIARLKIMSHLDVSERRVPQDGRISLSHEGKSIDVRVATIPSIEGETVSLRLLNQGNYNLEKLDLEDHLLRDVKTLLALTNGVILATGPTGSGKSTSLYSFLSELNTFDTRIVTIEDPVENKLAGIVQIAVKSDVGLTFARGLRSILRADPNIVMVGEIRDGETAEIAIRASLTGHLVFSTLHTNSAIGAVSRLVDMGVEPYLISASVRGLLAQRLVRKLCEHCKRPSSHWNDEVREQLGISPEFTGTPFEAVGCPECRHTGYSGRLGLYEVCIVSPEIQDMVSQGVDESQIRERALQEGFEDMRDYGIRKVMKGLTTIEEVFSSTQNHLVK
ncbi:GspE/PulE family protein [Akkermansiaceae bacterium]|nr:GspE/PulE family protein [Akkermansiaceae bacterium]